VLKVITSTSEEAVGIGSVVDIAASSAIGGTAAGVEMAMNIEGMVISVVLRVEGTRGSESIEALRGGGRRDCFALQIFLTNSRLEVSSSGSGTLGAPNAAAAIFLCQWN
jgi:hypothetical protein